MVLPAVASTVLFVCCIGHEVLVYITIHCIHLCSVQMNHMEDTVSDLNSLVSLTCAANEVVRLKFMLERLLRNCILRSCCHVDCIAH